MENSNELPFFPQTEKQQWQQKHKTHPSPTG
jgi:hypothetical protein